MDRVCKHGYHTCDICELKYDWEFIEDNGTMSTPRWSAKPTENVELLLYVNDDGTFGNSYIKRDLSENYIIAMNIIIVNLNKALSLNDKLAIIEKRYDEYSIKWKS